MLNEHIIYVSDPIRLSQFKAAIGKVMNPGDRIADLGCGSGILGLLCMRTGASFVYAIDDSAMLEIAKERKEALGLENIEILQMDIENLQFEDNTFDTVFSSFVFCTVPNPIKGLKQARRVLKEDGKAVFLEHMKSSKFINNIFLYMMNPLTKLLLGTSMIRETEKNIEKAGFKIEKTYYLYKDIVRLIIARK